MSVIGPRPGLWNQDILTAERDKYGASYSSIFIISLVPKLGCIFKEDSRKLAMILISLLYFIYMIALLLHGESGLYPYSFYRA